MTCSGPTWATRRTSRRCRSSSSCTVPPEQTYTSKRWQECNWLQALEGGIDSSHVSLAALGRAEERPAVQGLEGQRVQPGRPASRSSRSSTPTAGCSSGPAATPRRATTTGAITPWVMPAFTMVPPRGDHPVHGHFWVPIDDENCWAYTFDYHPARALTATEVQAMKDGHGRAQRERPRDLPAAGEQGQRLPDRPRGAEARARRTPASRASRSRTRRCRRAWARSSTAPRSGWSRPTAGSSRPGRSCGRRRWRCADEGTAPPGVDPAHHRVRSAVDRAAEGASRSSTPRRDAVSASPASRRRRSEASRWPTARSSPAAVRGRRPPTRRGFRIDAPLADAPGDPRRRARHGAMALVRSWPARSGTPRGSWSLPRRSARPTGVLRTSSCVTVARRVRPAAPRSWPTPTSS